MNKPTCETCPWFKKVQRADERACEGQCFVTPVREQLQYENYWTNVVEGSRIGCRYHPDWERFFANKKSDEAHANHVELCRALNESEDLTPDA